MTQVISRAVYPGSELATSKWIKDNSAICDITGYDIHKKPVDDRIDVQANKTEFSASLLLGQ
jgi:hypothetical protein